MNEPQREPLDPKPGGSGGYMWTVWADWNLVVVVGFVFLGIITAYAMIQFHFENKNQQESFQLAYAAIAKEAIAAPVTQRAARLLKTDGRYSWRAIVWTKEATGLSPMIWHSLVEKQDHGFILIESRLYPYDEQRAHSLELFDDITAGPKK